MSEITYDYQEILKRLSAYFPTDVIKSFPLTYTKDKTKALAAFYIDNRGVQQRLDDTCVWENVFKKDPRDSLGKAILSGIRILIRTPSEAGTFPISSVYQWLTRWDGAENSDIEGVKGGLSSAQRRAAVQWGIGRYLYAVESPWVEMKSAPVNRSGNPIYFKTTPRMPSAFLPEETDAQRARAVSSEPEKPASPTKAETNKAFKLSAAMTKKYAEAKTDKDLKKVAAIYESVITKGITPAEGLKQITTLPISK